MKNNSTISVSVQPTAADLHDLWRSSRARYLGWFLVVLGLFYTYLMVAEIVNCGFCSETASTIIQYGAVAALAFFGALFVPRLRARLMIRYGPTVRELRRYSLSDQGVHIESELLAAELRWGAFFKIEESRRSFLLYQSPLSAWVIPKRCFSTADELARLRDLLRANFGGKLSLRA
jgi:YcxB-like protein